MRTDQNFAVIRASYSISRRATLALLGESVLLGTMAVACQPIVAVTPTPPDETPSPDTIERCLFTEVERVPGFEEVNWAAVDENVNAVLRTQLAD